MTINLKDSADIERLVYKLQKEGLEPTNIADELLKLWNDNLTEGGKFSVGRFCILNGFLASLISILRKDLAKQKPLCWPLVFQCVVNFEKNFLDSFLVGAAQDKLLLELAQSALEKENKDPRWLKILTEELNEKKKSLEKMKDDLLQQLKIFENEHMQPEAGKIAKKLNQIFPNDSFIVSATNRYRDWEVADKISRIRNRFPKLDKFTRLEKSVPPADFVKAVKKNVTKLDLNGAYEFSIALREMGFSGLAREVLKSKESQWSVREEVIEIEYLLDDAQFIEALSKSQEILKKHSEKPEAVESCLYYSALAYFELQDREQALQILKAIHAVNPEYRNVDELLRIWRDG